MYICIYVYMYIYIYIEREREKEGGIIRKIIPPTHIIFPVRRFENLFRNRTPNILAYDIGILNMARMITRVTSGSYVPAESGG